MSLSALHMRTCACLIRYLLRRRQGLPLGCFGGQAHAGLHLRADRFEPLNAVPKAVLASVDTLENGQNGAPVSDMHTAFEALADCNTADKYSA